MTRERTTGRRGAPFGAAFALLLVAAAATGCGKDFSVAESSSDLRALDARRDTLSVRGIGDEDVAGLGRFRDVRVLDFTGGCAVLPLRMTATGFGKLAELDLPRVRLISLQHCPSVDDACLAHVGRMGGLDTVLLNDSTGFGREGLAAVAALPRLTCLDLRGCTQIDRSCVEALAAASHLERLGVTATSMSPDDVARLRVALPACHVDDDPAGIHVVTIDGARVRGWVELPGRTGR